MNMELLIMSREDARKYEPLKKMNVIGILPTCYDSCERIVQDRSEYANITNYCFDTVNCIDNMANLKQIDSALAIKILDDFEWMQEEVPCTLIHCLDGVTLGPAVAKALNDIFDLRNNMDNNYSFYHKHTYDTLMKARDELDL